MGTYHSGNGPVFLNGVMVNRILMNTTSKKCRVSLSEQCVLYVLCVLCVLCVFYVLCAVCSPMYKKKGKAVDPEKLCLCMPTLIRKLVTEE